MPLAGPNTSGDGHVFAVGGMYVSIWNGAFVKWLVNAPPVLPVVESLHSALSGGEVRFTSSCLRQEYAFPAWLTCVVCAASALARPFTPSQPPYRLSKLWF